MGHSLHLRIVQPPLQHLIGYHRLRDVLQNLNQIGKDNGGNRAFGTPGFKASLDFVLERVADRFADDVDSFVQPFKHMYEETRELWVKGPDDEKVHAISLMYNPSTPEGGVKAPLIDTPVDDDNGGLLEPPMRSK